MTLSKIQSGLITDGIITENQLASTLDLSGKVTTGHETLSDHVASNAWSGVGYTTGGYFVTLGSLTIPKPGIWRVSAQLRIRWGGADYFAKIYLTTSSQSGSSGTIADEIYAAGGGANTAARMLYERITVNGFGNILLEPSWIIDVPTGLTSGDTIYFSIQPSSADASALNNNDTNGRIGAHGIKIAETTTSGTTITTRGF